MNNIRESGSFFEIWKFMRRTAPAVAASAVLFASGAAAHDSLGLTMATVDRGAVNSFTTPTSQVLSAPWVRKYFANSGQCLTFEILQPVPNADLELVVIAPNPSIRYRDDNSGTCSLCPEIQINATSLGYYTVIANHSTGAPTTADFLIVVQRQAAGLTYCPTPTPPF
ncbi:MAG: hypothetical protein ACT4SY_06205 [Hyphomicrobiales bacterium]